MRLLLLALLLDCLLPDLLLTVVADCWADAVSAVAAGRTEASSACTVG